MSIGWQEQCVCRVEEKTDSFKMDNGLFSFFFALVDRWLSLDSCYVVSNLVSSTCAAEIAIFDSVPLRFTHSSRVGTSVL